MAGKHLGLPPGVEFVGDSIRIRFTWRGATPPRRCETLPFPQTAKGVQAAASLRAQVTQLIKHGALDDTKYLELFPNTSYALDRVEPTFGEYAQVWLNGRDIVEGTRKNYRATLNRHWMPFLAIKPVSTITAYQLRRIVTDTPWVSATAKRTALVRLRTLLNSAVKDGWLAKNPADAIDLPPKHRKEIDPYTREEADRIIDYLYEKYAGKRTEIYACAIEFAFYTGMRPGEQRALMISEVDEQARTASVHRTMTDDEGLVERVKNRKPRQVLLNDRALHALERARVARGRIRRKTAFVFPPAQGGDLMLDPQGPTGYLFEALEALGIRRRRQYDTRHTYATMCLMSDMKIAFIANQMGHTVEVLLTTYAKWINSAGDWSELAKLPMPENGTKSVQTESEKT
ncbi:MULTISPECIES: tyrosine-type recombinase/integrase [unclassified Pseudomonas]|uniref:tyrosine-type recombinase/integrase n=1 Tax=unclassified Pseudomonas TaxID=196821 RepID=UPI002447B38C|nr:MULTISPECIES: tyrosine-type recombinase/integrase [unclassified Pseudomonas]MDG9928490.1 tyrosine-type recombinase/integrase [Pseudomonas sp. GD04042]MDH0482660.1 tyrosine-type recombinase/integrase [Pseudomonas sp. GD04015]MDH0604638.1 tyrosine-type recombinase/integrase [Pseudomonas sp. GD03869]